MKLKTIRDKLSILQNALMKERSPKMDNSNVLSHGDTMMMIVEIANAIREAECELEYLEEELGEWTI